MKTFLQINTIFLSMIMEAIPFILLGVIVSGLIQTFATEKWIARIIPKNRLISSALGCGVGMLYPSCECGIVPITRRLLDKGLPLNAGIAFMLTGPIINPVVLFATYVAFGNDLRMMLIRAGTAIAVGFAVSVILPRIYPDLPLRIRQHTVAEAETAAAIEYSSGQSARIGVFHRIMDVMLHAIEEFFSVAKYLVFGAFIAACMQAFIPTSTLIHLGSNPITSSLVMMGLAFIMSVCSEADAFIASSFRSTFSIGSLSAFLVFGPMVDIKNTMMLLGVFRGKFVVLLIALAAGCTLAASLIVGRLFG